MEKINFLEKYSFDELTSALLNKQLSIDDWVTIFNRLYPKDNEQSSSSNTSFFAQELNCYRNSRLKSERVSKAGVTAVMIGGLIWCAELASTTIIGSASITIFILNATFTYLSLIIFNPQILCYLTILWLTHGNLLNIFLLRHLTELLEVYWIYTKATSRC